MLFSALRVTSVVAKCTCQFLAVVSLAVALPRSCVNDSGLAAAEPKPTATQPAPRSSVEKEASQRLLADFQRAYALPDDKVIKRIPLPFPPSRLEYYRVSMPEQAKAYPEGPQTMSFRWKEGKLVLGSDFGDNDGMSVADLVGNFTDIASYETQGDRKLLEMRIPGDWVIRDGVGPKKTLRELESFLRKECKVPIRFRLVREDRKVIVAEGKYTFHPLPGNDNITDEVSEPWDIIDVFEKDRSDMQDTNALDSGLNHLCSSASYFLNRRVLNEACRQSDNVLSCRWNFRRYVESREQRAKIDEAAVLKHLAEQTGLTFTEKTRRVRVLHVERAE